MKSPKKTVSLFLFFTTAAILSTLFFILPPKETKGNNDAVAIRVIPNPNHYSPSLWFERQGFSGPRQALLVDGYEAIRSGNTVYVNVANIAGANLYTNIYMISSTEESSSETKEIFSQILDNWKFNTNINPVGTCQKEVSIPCTFDTDCKSGDYCNGDKARIIRDVKRLSDAVLIKEALEEYKQKNSHYPILAAGSYLPNVSISAWPSWSEALAKELGKSIPRDPLNILGNCPGYDEKTCWNENNKEFVTDIKSGIIPSDSNIYLYLTDSRGSAYTFCFTEDSGYIGPGAGACPGAGGFGFGGSATNRQPVFTGTNLSTAYVGDSYSGYIQAFDADGDNISWSIDTSLSSWTGWSAPVELRNTVNPNQKEIYASVVGPNGDYSFSLTIDDGRGEANSVNTSVFTIRVGNIPPKITYSDYTYTASSTNPLAYSLTAYDSAPGNMPLTHSLISGALFPGVTSAFDGNIAQYEMNGIITPGFSIPTTTNFPYTVRITDNYGASADANFRIRVINNKPIFLSANCNDPVRTGDTLNCTLSARDPEGNILTYSVPYSTIGTVNVNSTTGEVNISNITSEGNHFFDYEIEDEYGAIISGRRNFIANTYCGDGIKQVPNMERQGGFSNAGLEQCDGTDGLITSASASSPTSQYGCNSDCLALAGGWCGDSTRNGPEQCDGTDGSFATPDTSSPTFQYACAGDCTATAGGWCGDGVVQTAPGEECEPGEPIDEYVSRTGDTSVVGDPARWQAIKLSCNASDCTIGCISDPLLAEGCYLDTNNNNIIDSTECQKGKNICVGNNLECFDVYTNAGLPPKFDYCCSGEKEKLACADNSAGPCALVSDIGPFTIARALPSDIVFTSTGGFYGSFGGVYANVGTTFYYYTCDYVCKQLGQVCIGVGLNNHEVMSCTSVVHDSGASCLNAGNTVYDDCKSLFSLAGASTVSSSLGYAFQGYLGTCSDGSSISGLSSNYHVGETACYCQ